MNIKTSNKFNKTVAKAVAAIVAFVFVYLLLLAFAVALTALCVVGGFIFVVSFPKFITILIGIGLVSLGVIVLTFIIKFLFKTHKVDRSNLLEINRKDYPQLFALIDDIVKDTKTSFPKKVYLSGEINASVFYDSSFWSLFLPVRKNLHIGLGLVNTVTEQELKAILAHEFGHFSQRSMSVGSYVYYVNEVIFNMLYDNESFDNMIQAWANFMGYFAIFVIASVKIIHGIQWVLKKMYGFVNLRYLALSREMEFHADEVAANVAGSKPLQEALLRLDLSMQSYNEVLQFYGTKIADNIKSKNVYQEQLFVLNFLGKKNNMSFNNHLPSIPLSEINKYKRSKLNIEDQWSSHPTMTERVTALEKLNIETKEVGHTNPAMDLLPNAQTLSEALTEKLFSNVEYQGTTSVLSLEEFGKEYSGKVNRYDFPEEYNGYYDNKNPNVFEIDSITDLETTETMNSLFSKEKIDTIHILLSLESDFKTLKSIESGEISVHSFDYDGQKYKIKDIKSLKNKILKEVDEIKAQLTTNDVNIYKYFYQQARLKGKEQELKDAYSDFFAQDQICNSRIELYESIIIATNFLREQTKYEMLEYHFSRLAEIEVKLKAELNKMLDAPYIEEVMNKTLKKDLDKYMSKDWAYSANDSADNEYLNTLFEAFEWYEYLIWQIYFIEKSKLLNYQISLIKDES